MITINLQGGFVGLDDELQALIDEYGLTFTRRKQYEEGWIEDKTWTCDTVGYAWDVAQAFARE